MTKIEKIVQRFLAKPMSLRYSEVEKVLLHLSFEKINAKGSHKKFKHPLLKQDLVIPVHGNDCKDFYKKLAAKTIKQYHLHK